MAATSLDASAGCLGHLAETPSSRETANKADFVFVIISTTGNVESHYQTRRERYSRTQNNMPFSNELPSVHQTDSRPSERLAVNR
jgi:hypothetical protein